MSEEDSKRRVTKSQTREQQLELDTGPTGSLQGEQERDDGVVEPAGTGETTAGGPGTSDIVACTDVVGLRSVLQTDDELTIKQITENEANKNENESETQALTQAERSKELRTKVINNGLILGKISEGLPATNLMGLRQTCSLWNNNFIPQLKRTHKIFQLTSTPYQKVRGRTSDFMKVFESSTNIPFGRYKYEAPFSRVVARREYNQHGGFRPNRQLRDNVRVETWGNFQYFISKFGSTITRLDLQWDHHLDLPLSDLRRLIFELTPELVELHLSPPLNWPESETNEKEPTIKTSQRFVKMLPKLKSLRVHQNSESPSFSVLLSDVIECANGLEVLELVDFRRTGMRFGSHEEDFVHPISDITSLPNLSKLKSLMVSKLKPAELQILIQSAAAQLRLDSFMIQVDRILRVEENTDDEVQRECTKRLHDFLATQSPTLKKLGLTFEQVLFEADDEDDEEDRNRVSFRTPRMSHVTCLELNGCEKGAGHFGQLEFDNTKDTFQNTFPKLEKISFRTWWELLNLNHIERVSHTGVKELEVSTETSPNNLIKFVHLGPVFPSLTRLELKLVPPTTWGETEAVTPVDMNEYAKVWNLWPGLTSVKLTGIIEFEGGMNFDAFITGIPAKKLEGLRQKLDSTVLVSQSPECLLASLRKILNEFKHGPGISDLTQLKNITISIQGRQIDHEWVPSAPGYKLTDIGGYLGLALASPLLQHVFIRGNEKNEVSEECQECLRNIFDLFAVIDL